MKNNRRKKKRWVDGFIGKAFIICLLILILGNLLVPNKKKSDEENRMLSGKTQTDNRRTDIGQLYGTV